MLIVAASAAAAAVPVVTLEVESDATPRLHVRVENVDVTALALVRPRVVFEHETLEGASIGLDTGAAKDWRFQLPPATRRGTVPVTVHVEYVDGGVERSVPAVTLVQGADAAPGPIRARLTAAPVAGSGRTRVELENTSVRPVSGRLFVVLPSGLGTEPQSLPVQVPAEGSVVVPLMLENRDGLPDGDYPIHVVFEYARASIHYAAHARTTVPVGGDGDPRTVPLVISGVALAIVVGLLGLAMRAARPKAVSGRSA